MSINVLNIHMNDLLKQHSLIIIYHLSSSDVEDLFDIIPLTFMQRNKKDKLYKKSN